jgi:serine/threonine protein kinase
MQKSRLAKRKTEYVPLKEDLLFKSTPITLNQRVLGGSAVVKEITGENSFVVWHEDFRQELAARKISVDEDISGWVNMQQHSNIVTAFDTFTESESRYALVELTNAGSVYQFISCMHLDLKREVPLYYRELVFDIVIQLATGLEFAHNNGLAHGRFDLTSVVIDREGSHLVFKILDFAPVSSLKLLERPEASYWPFFK